MKRVLFAIAPLMLVSWVSAVQVDTNFQKETIVEDGITRDFYVHRPTDSELQGAKPTVVMLLHGSGGNGREIASSSGFLTLAEKKHFILVAPDGLGKRPGWNCGFISLGQSGVNDFKFLTDVLNKVEQEGPYDSKEVFLCGYSNGAFMSYALGSRLSKEIAAIGVVSGTVGLDPKYPLTQSTITLAKMLGVEIPAKFESVPPPTYPVSAIIFHGEKDKVIPYDHLKSALVVSAVSAPDSAAFWAKACGLSMPVHSSDQGVDYTKWHSGNKDVVFITLPNGTHDWPGAGGNLTEAEGNLDAASLIWDFFVHHPKSG